MPAREIKLQRKSNQTRHDRCTANEFLHRCTRESRDRRAGTGRGLTRTTTTTSRVGIITTGRCSNELKVRAGQTGGIVVMNNNRAVSEETGGTGSGGGVEVEVGVLVGSGTGDVAVFAT